MFSEKVTDLGRDLASSEKKRTQSLLEMLEETQKRLEKNIRQGIKKAEYESHAHCLDAVCVALAFLRKATPRQG